MFPLHNNKNLMKLSGHSFVFFSFFLLTSCENQNSSVPENNNFSYLEKNQETKPKEDTTTTTLTDYTNLTCLKKHSELKGNLIIKEFDFSNNNKEFNKLTILELAQPFLLECEKDEKISSNQVILQFEDDNNIDLYLGNMVIAIGEISKSSSTNNKFPLEMKVIRLQPL